MQSDILSPAAFSECCLLLGDVYLQRRQNANARRWLEYAVASGMDSPELRVRLAMAQAGPGGNQDRARELLANVTEEDQYKFQNYHHMFLGLNMNYHQDKISLK